MHLFHISQHTIQNRNVHNSVLNGAFGGMGHMHCGIYELDQLSVAAATTAATVVEVAAETSTSVHVDKPVPLNEN